MQAEVSFVEDRSALEGDVAGVGRGLMGGRQEESRAVVIRKFNQLVCGEAFQGDIRAREVRWDSGNGGVSGMNAKNAKNVKQGAGCCRVVATPSLEGWGSEVERDQDHGKEGRKRSKKE